jgi:hypothetical protein
MGFSTGNDERDLYLKACISFLERHHEPVTFERVVQRLDLVAKVEQREPFGLKRAELAGMLADQGVTFEDEHEHSSQVPFDPVSGNTVAPAQNDPVGSSPVSYSEVPATLVTPENEHKEETPAARRVTRADAAAAVRAIQSALTEARLDVRRTDVEVQDARHALAKAVEQWQRNSATKQITPEQNARNYANASLEERRRRAALYGNGGSAKANAFARRQRMVPPGVDPMTLTKGGSRGARPASERILGTQRSTGPVLPETAAMRASAKVEIGQ